MFSTLSGFFTSPNTVSARKPNNKLPYNLVVRMARPEDSGRIQQFFNDPSIRPNEGAPPRSEAQWWWEFGGPRAVSPQYVIAECDSRLVGTQAYIPIEFSCDGRILRTGKDEDTLIDPEFRGRGILDRMYELLCEAAVCDGVEVLWGFTRTAIRPLIRNGYQAIGQFLAMRRDLRLPIRQPMREPDLQLDILGEVDSGCDEFASSFKAQIAGLSPYLSAEFLRWRVFSNPYRSHEVWGARLGHQLVGLAVLKLEPGSAVAFISELAALETGVVTQSTIQENLLAAGLASLARRGYQTVEIRPSGDHPYNQSLRRLLRDWKFMQLDPVGAATFLVRPLGETGARGLDFNRWRISEIMREY